MSFWRRWSYWLVFLILAALVAGLARQEQAAGGQPPLLSARMVVSPQEGSRSEQPQPSLAASSPSTSTLASIQSERRRLYERFSRAPSFAVLAASVLAEPTPAGIEYARLYLLRCRALVPYRGERDPEESIERFAKFCGEDIRKRDDLMYAINAAHARVEAGLARPAPGVEANRQALMEDDPERAIETMTSIPAEQMLAWAKAHGVENATAGLKSTNAMAAYSLASLGELCLSMGCDQRYWSAFFCVHLPSTCGAETFPEQLDLAFAEVIGDPQQARVLWPQLQQRVSQFRRSQLGQG